MFAKTDIENAFEMIPVHPSDHGLLGFRVGELYYFDKTLPMSLSYSCNLFERFSSSLHWIIQNSEINNGILFWGELCSHFG
jgi:hypothetical protein